MTVVLAAAAPARAETPIPDPPQRWLTDEVGFVSPTARAEIDQRLSKYARDTGHQVIVYIGRTTGDVPIEDWAVKAFQRWKIGRKGIDDGLALFVFAADRKIRIEVGYGLEPILVDAKASQIIRDVIAPRVREGDRDGAVRAGVDAILNTLGTKPEEAVPRPPRPRFSAQDKQTLWIVGLGFLAIPVLLLLLVGVGMLFFPDKLRQRRTGARSGRAEPETGPSVEIESTSSSGADDGFSGGGGTSGGGGASGSW